MKLWLQRHAPVLCAPGLCYGATDHAAEDAATQAAAAALAAELPAGVALWSSPLVRCLALAQEVAELRPDLPPVRIDARLAEMDFGAWEGQPWRAIARGEFDAWTADFADARPGGHGESTRQFMARVAGAWDDWRAVGADAAWVTHSGVMRAVELIARGVRVPASAADWPSAPMAFGARHCVEIDTGATHAESAGRSAAS